MGKTPNSLNILNLYKLNITNFIYKTDKDRSKLYRKVLTT